MSAEERTHFDQTTELLQQYSRWIVLKLVEGKSPRRWVFRDPNQLQELVEKLAQYEPYGVKCYRESLDDELEWPVDCQPAENDIFGQIFGSVRVMIAAMKAEVVEVTIPSKGIILWIQQAFDRQESVHQAIAEYYKKERKAEEKTARRSGSSSPTLGERMRAEKLSRITGP